MMGLTMAQGAPPAAEKANEPPPASELSSEEVLTYIVEHVNSELDRTYSLVDFDAIKGNALLQVTNDIFTKLHPPMEMDMDSLPQEESIPKMLDFLLKTLGYRVPPFLESTFPQSFAEADTTVMYPTLYWILSHMEQNAKRVYLSRFLQPLDIPEDLRTQDDDVRGLYEQYQQLRMAFIQTHRRVEGLRSDFADPVEARKKVSTMEEEKEKLSAYIQAAEKKLSGCRDKDALLAASKSLRLAQEEETKLSEKRVEQQQAKISADLRQSEIANRLQNVRRDATDGRVDVIVRRMRDETQTNRIKLDEQLPLEIDAKKKENNEFQKLVSEPLDMPGLTAEERKLDEALKELHQKVAERQRPGEDGASITTIRQQLQRIKANKDDSMNQLHSLQADYNRCLSTIRERENHIAQLRSASNMMKSDDFRDFSNQVRSKKAATESMRARITEMRAEWGTLTFTQSVLEDRYKQLDKAIGNLESKLGVQGYSRTVEALSKLTQEKDTLEEIKGKTLEELSRVVQDFTVAIREGQTKLAPLINELRTVRQTAAEIDQEWSEKKSQYEYQNGLLMEDIQKLDNEVTKLKEECQNNESIYHRLHVQNVILGALAKRTKEEQEFRTNPSASLDPQYKTYLDFFTDLTQTVEQRTRELQIKRRDLDENHDTDVQQVEHFALLKRILEEKLKYMANQATDDGGRQNLDHDIHQVMGYGGNADMLVLNNN